MKRLVLLLSLGACARPVAPSPAPEARPELDPAAGIASERLGALLRDHWRWVLDTSPETATALGLSGQDDRVSDPSVAAADAAHAVRVVLLVRLDAIEADGLQPRDAQFARLLREQLEAGVATRACRNETWALSPRSNAMVDLFSALDLQPIDAPSGRADVLARLRAWASSVPVAVEGLRQGMREGRVATAESVRRIVAQIDAQLAEPAASWPLVVRARSEAPDHAGVFTSALEEHVAPGLRAYRDFLADEVLPVARGDEASGVVHLPDGAACYAARVQTYLGAPRDPEALHRLGLEAIASVHAEFRALGARALGTDDLATIFARLRGDPGLRFADGAAVRTTAEAALRRAEAAVPRAFGRLPETPCEVKEIPAHEAPFTTIAYYRPPPADRSRAGAYFVNTYAPETRPVHEAEVLAFHEAVPGHHLQIAIAQELPEVPAFHRFEGSTAFVEGWALYAERLADDLGLYSSDLDRLGMLSFDAWRAGRLVVDTGLHHHGWSRSDAVRYLQDNTPLALNNVDNEVDRYVSWPGQALAYKVGQLEILALRAEAEAALGTRFDLGRFHDVVLGEGAVSLPILRERVRTWIEGGGS